MSLLGCVFTSIRGWFHSFRFWLLEASPLLARLAAATACAWAFFAIGRCLRSVQWGRRSDARPRQPLLPDKPNPVVDPIPEPWPKSREPEGESHSAEEEEEREASRKSSYDNAIQQGSELEPNEKTVLEQQLEAHHDNPEQSEQPPHDPDATPLLPTSTGPPVSTVPTATATAGSAVRRRQFRVKQQSYMEAISHGMIATPAPEPSIPEEDTPTKPQATPTSADHPSVSEERNSGQVEVSRRYRTSPQKQASYMEAIKQGVGRQDRVEDDIPPRKPPPLDPVEEVGRLETEI